MRRLLNLKVAAVATVNKVNPLNANIPIVDGGGRPTLEFMLKWSQQAANNGATVKDSDVGFTDHPVSDASILQHGYLRKLSGVAAQYLAGDGSFRAIQYDRDTYLPTVVDSTIVYRFVAALAFSVTLSSCQGNASLAPSGGTAIFTLKKNGGSIGTLTFASGSSIAVASGAGASFVAGDVLSISVGVAHAIAGVALTVAGTLI